MTSFENQDYCPECWHLYLAKFLETQKPGVEANACRTQYSDFTRSHRLCDGWGAVCEVCKALVFVPFSRTELESSAKKRPSAVGWHY